MDNCIFCKIARKEIETTIIAEGEDWICFKDQTPKAPTHWLLIPKEHVENFHTLKNEKLSVSLWKAIQEVVEQNGLTENGYRVVTNTGKDGGQSVFHLHFHIFAKRAMGWPPG